VLLSKRIGHTGGGLDPEDAERVRRRGYAVGSQRALDRVDCAAALVRVAEGPATAALALLGRARSLSGAAREYARAIAGSGERIARSVRQ
jgi:DNA-binding IclR family transcriptional regulator